MSYNISVFKVKKLKNLVLPVEKLLSCERKLTESLSVEFTDCETYGVRGVLTRDRSAIRVSGIEIYGEGSGRFMIFLEEEVFPDSSGELELVRVWEGGDFVDRFYLKDGEMNTKEIDL